jgi:hypothetical protein
MQLFIVFNHPMEIDHQLIAMVITTNTGSTNNYVLRQLQNYPNFMNLKFLQNAKINFLYFSLLKKNTPLFIEELLPLSIESQVYDNKLQTRVILGQVSSRRRKIRFTTLFRYIHFQNIKNKRKHNLKK